MLKVSLFEAYVKPLYNLPVLKIRLHLGVEGYPFNLSKKKLYTKKCVIAEELHQEQFICFEPCAYEIDKKKTNY